MANNHDKYFDLKDLAEHSSLSVRTNKDYISNEDDPLEQRKITKLSAKKL